MKFLLPALFLCGGLFGQSLTVVSGTQERHMQPLPPKTTTLTFDQAYALCKSRQIDFVAVYEVTMYNDQNSDPKIPSLVYDAIYLPPTDPAFTPSPLLPPGTTAAIACAPIKYELHVQHVTGTVDLGLSGFDPTHYTLGSAIWNVQQTDGTYKPTVLYDAFSVPFSPGAMWNLSGTVLSFPGVVLGPNDSIVVQWIPINQGQIIR